jgi:hypothetical protein
MAAIIWSSYSPHLMLIDLFRWGSKDAVYVLALSTTFAEFAGNICTVAAKVTFDMSCNVWIER